MSAQEMLEEAIKNFGVNDIRTLELSQRRDKEIVEAQEQIYKFYKEKNYVSAICN